MPKLTIVVGLPGAGKSSYCKRYAPGGVCYEDVCHPSRTRSERAWRGCDQST